MTSNAQIKGENSLAEYKFNILFTKLDSVAKIPIDTVYKFSRSEIITLTNKIKDLQDLVNIDNQIIITFEERIKKSDELENIQSIQISNLKTQNENLQKLIQSMQPSWYENKWLIFGSGVIVGTIGSIYILKKI